MNLDIHKTPESSGHLRFFCLKKTDFSKKLPGVSNVLSQCVEKKTSVVDDSSLAVVTEAEQL